MLMRKSVLPKPRKPLRRCSTRINASASDTKTQLSSFGIVMENVAPGFLTDLSGVHSPNVPVSSSPFRVNDTGHVVAV